ncbi:hypothetical protein VP01_7720g1, partial [Puccinia sorghi]
VWNFYYDGFTSWSWFYPYFYSPMISGSTSSPSILSLNFFFLGPLKCRNSFQLNPFFCIEGLMIGLESPIFDLYPLCDSKMDLDGKNLHWEAIFKIPFTYQERILESMKVQLGKFNPSIWEHKLLDEEQMMVYNLPAMKGLRLIKGLCKGFLLGKDSIYGFPTLHNLPRTGTLWFHKIKLNPSKSKAETII